MKRRCEYLNCPLPPTGTHECWGQKFDLCDEHGDLVGNDHSVSDSNLEVAN